MSGSTEKKTTTDTGPWKPAQGFLTDIMGKADTLGSDASMFTPIQGQASRDALNQFESFARSGSNASLDALKPVVQGSTQGFNAGLGQLMSTVNGNYNNPASNPELMNYINQSNNLVADRVNGQFSGAGRYGSNGANTNALASALSRNTSGILMDQYNRERSNQVSAGNTLLGAGFNGAQMAPALDNATLQNASLLQQVGGMRDALATAERQAPMSALEWQKNMIAPIGAMGQAGNTTETTKSSNPGGTALGIGMAGLGMMTGNPMLMQNGMGTLMSSTGGTAANGGWSTNTYKAGMFG